MEAKGNQVVLVKVQSVPTRRGGGIASPTQEAMHTKMPKKMRRLAYAQALSFKSLKRIA